MKLFNDLHYLPMSHIDLPLCIILPRVSFCPSIILPPPPENRLMIYAIDPCPVSFCPLDSFCPPYHFAPYHFAPWKLLMNTIFPFPYHFAPYHFAPLSFCPPGNCFMIYTIVQYHFAPWILFAPISFCPHISLPPENGLMIYTIYPCPVSFCPLH